MRRIRRLSNIYSRRVQFHWWAPLILKWAFSGFSAKLKPLCLIHLSFPRIWESSAEPKQNKTKATEISDVPILQWKDKDRRRSRPSGKTDFITSDQAERHLRKAFNVILTSKIKSEINVARKKKTKTEDSNKTTKALQKLKDKLLAEEPVPRNAYALADDFASKKRGSVRLSVERGLRPRAS